MRIKHVLWTAALGAVVAALPVGGAHAAVDGKGTAEAALTVLGVELGADGSVLSVRLLGDDAVSTIDGTRASDAALRPLTVSSDLLPADLEVPPVSVSSTSGESTESTETVSLDTLATSGSLEPATLTAIVDAAGARAGINSSLVDLTAVGGLLDVESVAAGVSTDAAGTSASSIRSVQADAITVLNLGALLEGLGIDLELLPLDTLYGLLGELGVDVEGLSAEDLEALVDQLNSAVDGLQDIVDGATTELSAELCGTVDGLGLDTGGVLGDCSSTVTLTVGEASALLDDLQDELSSLLGSILATLDGAALLSLDGVTANVGAVAADTVAASAATVEAVIGSISVGGVSIPGVDGTATVEAVNQLVEDVTGQLNTVLGTISPELAGLVDIDVLDINRSVSEANGYVTAAAGVTALRATITPPDIAALIEDLLEPATTTLGIDLPSELVLGASMDALEDGLGAGTVSAMSSPSTVEVVTLGNTATFAPGAGQVAPPPGGGGGELPRTGADAAFPVMIGVLMAGAAVGLRRLLRSTSTS